MPILNCLFKPFKLDIIYVHDLNKPSNIEFKQNTTTNHTIVSGETFILIIGPNKSFTVI